MSFTFDTVDASVNNRIGWMVDNVTIRACPVHGGPGTLGAAAGALATAQPALICQPGAGTVDAVGSYCTACNGPLSFQWMEGGAPIGGATSISYPIPPTHPLGNFDYTVAIGCPGQPACAAESSPVPVAVAATPDPVGATLDVFRVNNGADLRFTWSDVTGADDYVVLSSQSPQGTFVTAEGTAASGVTGVTIPLPAGPLLYYKVVGHNAVCGQGPQQ